jgi:hypothetical protein
MQVNKMNKIAFASGFLFMVVLHQYNLYLINKSHKDIINKINASNLYWYNNHTTHEERL